MAESQTLGGASLFISRVKDCKINLLTSKSVLCASLASRVTLMYSSLSSLRPLMSGRCGSSGGVGRGSCVVVGCGRVTSDRGKVVVRFSSAPCGCLRDWAPLCSLNIPRSPPDTHEARQARPLPASSTEGYDAACAASCYYLSEWHHLQRTSSSILLLPWMRKIWLTYIYFFVTRWTLILGVMVYVTLPSSNTFRWSSLSCLSSPL